MSVMRYSIEIGEACSWADVAKPDAPVKHIDTYTWRRARVLFLSPGASGTPIFVTHDWSQRHDPSKPDFLNRYAAYGATNIVMVTWESTEFVIVDGCHRASALVVIPPAKPTSWSVFVARTRTLRDYEMWKCWQDQDPNRPPFLI